MPIWILTLRHLYNYVTSTRPQSKCDANSHTVCDFGEQQYYVKKCDIEFEVQNKGWDIWVSPWDLPPSFWENVPSLTDFQFGNHPLL